MVQFASYLRRVLCETRLIFPCINGPNVFARQVVVTLALSDTRLAICVSLPSFAFVSCDFFPFRIKGKIICELVSWKSWYSRHWVKPLSLPSLIFLRLFCSFSHLKFSWRDFSASQGRNSSVHFNVLIYLKSCSACVRLRNLHEYGLGAYKPITSESITVFSGFGPRWIFMHAFEPVNSLTIINSTMSPVRFLLIIDWKKLYLKYLMIRTQSLLRWVGYFRASLT